MPNWTTQPGSRSRVTGNTSIVCVQHCRNKLVQVLERRMHGPVQSSLSIGLLRYDGLFISWHSTVEEGDKNAILCGCTRKMLHSLGFAILLSPPSALHRQPCSALCAELMALGSTCTSDDLASFHLCYALGTWWSCFVNELIARRILLLLRLKPESKYTANARKSDTQITTLPWVRAGEPRLGLHSKKSSNHF